jgi:hypothetical protein
MNNDFNVSKDIIKKRVKNKRQLIPKKILFSDDEDIPDKIIVYLSNKINLDQIDKAILHKFKQLKIEIIETKKEVENLFKKIDDIVIESEKLNIQIKIKEKEDYIKNIEEDIILKKYEKEKGTILLDYKNNLDVIKDYLEIAKKYINIEVIKKIEDIIKCNGCNLDLKEIGENFDGVYICPDCNCINNYIKPIKYIKDSEHYIINYGDDDINNFIKVLSKFEGKNVSIIPNYVYEKLDEYFININMEKGDYYKKLPFLEDGKKENTSKKKMWSALEELGYNQYYDEINYITHVYWGWKLPDLTLYKDQIIKDYQLTQQVWQKIKKDYKRSASLGTQFRLYSHLRSIGYPYCKREDFKIQDMIESLRTHNDAWKIMCEETGVKFYPVI